jgi:hypothetical protein
VWTLVAVTVTPGTGAPAWSTIWPVISAPAICATADRAVTPITRATRIDPKYLPVLRLDKESSTVQGTSAQTDGQIV